MKSIRPTLFLALVLCLCACRGFALPTFWQTLAPGLEYATLKPSVGFSSGKIHAFRIDLQHFSLDLGLTQEAEENKNFPEVVLAQDAVIGTNGGFFSPTTKPIGLRIHQGK